jgi:hypothetical protein
MMMINHILPIHGEIWFLICFKTGLWVCQNIFLLLLSTFCDQWLIWLKYLDVRSQHKQMVDHSGALFNKGLIQLRVALGSAIARVVSATMCLGSLVARW